MNALLIRLLLRYLPHANTSKLHDALTALQGLKTTQRIEMTSPSGIVQIPQADLDNFATELAAVKTALAAYIETLKANQSQPLPAASEAGLQQALADLQSLEPPAGA